MNKLYVLQYNDDPYCAPCAGEIFTSKAKAYKYIKDNDMEDFRYVSVYEYDDEIKGYQESNHLYFIDKTDYPENAKPFPGYL